MSAINFTVVLLAVLAVWRVTHLLVAEDGPWDALAHLRRGAAKLGLGRLVSCFYCASVWVAIPFALLLTREWRGLVLCIPALSGGAMVIERLTARDEPAVWFEEKEEQEEEKS